MKMTEEQGQCVPSFQLQRSITTGRLRRRSSLRGPSMQPVTSLRTHQHFHQHILFSLSSCVMFQLYQAGCFSTTRKVTYHSHPPTQPHSINFPFSFPTHFSSPTPHLFPFSDILFLSPFLLKNSFPRRMLSLYPSLYLSTLSHPRSLLDRI